MTARGPSTGVAAGRRDAIEAVWALFVSLKLTLWLLVALAGSSVLGSLLSPSIGQRAGGAVLALCRALELQDVFHSWWFTLLLWGLALNLIACTLERLPRVWLQTARTERRLLDSVLRERRYVARVPTAAGPATIPQAEVERVSLVLARHGFAPAIVEDAEAGSAKGTVYLFAERGRLARFGAHLTHLALLVILLGGIIGRLGGAEGLVQVSEAQGAFQAVPIQAADGTAYPLPLGFGVMVEDFRLLTFVDGTPRQYQSDLVVFESEGVAARQTISVNHPLHWGGWTFYQASAEPIPDAVSAKVEIVDRLTGVRAAHTLLAEQAVEAGEGVRFGLIEYAPDQAGAGPALHLAREEDALVTDFWVFLRHPGFDARNREDRWSVDFLGLEPVYLTGIKAVRDPGADIVFAGCVLLALGLAQSFFSSHRRVWARVDAKEIVLAGGAHRNPRAFAKTFAAMEAELRRGREGSAGQSRGAAPGLWKRLLKPPTPEPTDPRAGG
ncbi:MAG: cytochrome c biogenesis protein ResB [Deltaproteobacteria bacterium]|nr:cytochrome c biogenesis protein ResB [Deltaproteobacteria bacterium]